MQQSHSHAVMVLQDDEYQSCPTAVRVSSLPVSLAHQQVCPSALRIYLHSISAAACKEMRAINPKSQPCLNLAR
jgi:hypothetical protein